MEVYPQVSTLPTQVIPKEIDLPNWKAFNGPLRLLLVGRDYPRKGIDIAIKVVHLLNEMGTRAKLTVCGTQGKSDEFVRFVGPYKKATLMNLNNMCPYSVRPIY